MKSLSGPFAAAPGPQGIAVALLAAMAAGACATMEPPAGTWNPPPPGSSYVRVQDNTGSFGNGRREEKFTVERGSWNGAEVLAVSGAQGTQLWDTNSRLLAILDKAGKPALTWNPPEGSHGFRFPLEVGKTWTESSTITMANGKTMPHDNACRVEGREDVTVPAGTFSTYRIDCTSRRGLESVQWYAPGPGLIVKQTQKRTAANPFGGAGTREEQLVSIDRKR